MEQKLQETLNLISEAPDGILDKRITTRIKELKGKPIPEIKTEVRHIIDDCVYGSLASDFGMNTLLALYYTILDGTKDDFNNENCPWRTNI